MRCCFLSKVVLRRVLAGARQRGCFYHALVEVAGCKRLSQKAINLGERFDHFSFYFSLFKKLF